MPMIGVVVETVLLDAISSTAPELMLTAFTKL